jgi:hypothetical protein
MLSVVQPVQCWIVGWPVHSELENMWADVAVTWYQILPSHLSGGNGHNKNHESRRSTSSPGKWHHVTWHLVPDILRWCEGLIFKHQNIHEGHLDLLTLEDETIMRSQNVRNQICWVEVSHARRTDMSSTSLLKHMSLHQSEWLVSGPTWKPPSMDI